MRRGRTQIPKHEHFSDNSMAISPCVLVTDSKTPWIYGMVAYDLGFVHTLGCIDEEGGKEKTRVKEHFHIQSGSLCKNHFVVNYLLDSFL